MLMLVVKRYVRLQDLSVALTNCLPEDCPTFLSAGDTAVHRGRDADDSGLRILPAERLLMETDDLSSCVETYHPEKMPMRPSPLVTA